MKQDEYHKIRKELFSKADALTNTKSNDYTDTDVFDNFNMCRIAGITRSQGIFARLTDKVSRLANFVKDKEMQVTSEKLDDTILDLINYSVYLYASMQEEYEVKQ